AAFGRETRRAKRTPSVVELGGEYRSVPGEDFRLARCTARQVAVLLFDKKLEAIARLEIDVEIDLAAEDIGQAQRKIDGLTRRFHRRKERWRAAIDRAADDVERARFLDRDDFGDKRRGGARARNAQETVAVDLVFESLQRAIDLLLDSIRLSLPDLSRIEHRRRARDDVGNIVVGYRIRTQHR